MPITSVERCQGWFVMAHASTGPATITATTSTVSNAPAAASERPSPWTK